MRRKRTSRQTLPRKTPARTRWCSRLARISLTMILVGASAALIAGGLALVVHGGALIVGNDRAALAHDELLAVVWVVAGSVPAIALASVGQLVAQAARRVIDRDIGWPESQLAVRPASRQPDSTRVDQPAD